MTDERMIEAAIGAERARAVRIFTIGRRFGCPEEAIDAVASGTLAVDFEERIFGRQEGGVGG